MKTRGVGGLTVATSCQLVGGAARPTSWQLVATVVSPSLSAAGPSTILLPPFPPPGALACDPPPSSSRSSSPPPRPPTSSRSRRARSPSRPSTTRAASPSAYRLTPTEFAYELKPKRELVVSEIDIYELTFPSPVTTKYPENNTVHADYYVPKGKGPFPGVIILDILDGSQVVSRGIATVLAAHGIAGLCVQMPYYGPRRPAEGKVRLISPDVQHTMDAIRQTVLD